MKTKILILLLLTAILWSCTKNNTSTAVLDDTVDTIAILKHKGTFMSGPYGTVSGEVKIYCQQNQFTLALENLSSSNGPDLHVYLSKEVQPVNFIDLGLLQSVNGNQVYSINGRPDFTQYKYALIHCQRYNHLFGSALLQ